MEKTNNLKDVRKMHNETHPKCPWLMKEFFEDALSPDKTEIKNATKKKANDKTHL